MNVPRLQRVAARIVEHADRFDMDDYVCGSVCCIGGWAALDAGMIRLRDELGADYRWYELVGEAFGLDQGQEPPYVSDVFRLALDLTQTQAALLFHVEHWPMMYAEQYDSARDQRERAEVAAKRIKHFIRTKGEQ